MDTELLRTFLEVRNTRHFGRAAQNLCITQAAVSARIKQLEDILGVTLFIRSRNNIRPSAEGERLVPHAEGVLQTLAMARRDVAREDGVTRRIQLGARAGIWATNLQHRLALLQESEPELVVQVQSLEAEEIIPRLVERSLDMALVDEPPDLDEFTSVPIGELKLSLYNAPGEDPQFYRQLQLVFYAQGGQGTLLGRVARFFAGE